MLPEVTVQSTCFSQVLSMQCIVGYTHSHLHVCIEKHREHEGRGKQQVDGGRCSFKQSTSKHSRECMSH